MKFVAQIYETPLPFTHTLTPAPDMTFITSVNILNIIHNIKIFHKTNISAEVCKRKNWHF